MIRNRCKWAVLWSGIVLAATAYANLPPAEVVLASDLDNEGHRAEQACIPLVLEFAADDCHYCTLLEEEVLKPILRNREYDQRVLMRKLLLDQATELRNFSGESVNPSELADHYNVFVTPTLLFVDSRGNELAERMVGVTTLEFYGVYLDQALDQSSHRLRELRRCQ